jgi:hypothetical protein
MLAALGSATRRAEYCAVIDASDSLDPHSLAVADIDLDRLLWVRCGENSPRRQPSTSLGRKSPLLANPARSGAPGFCFGGRQDPSVLRTGFETEKTKDQREVGLFSQDTFDFDGRKNKKNLRSSEYRLEQVLRATDLLLESGGFGLIILDLADIPPQSARRIPLTTWFRFRRAVEHKPTILLAIEQQPIAGSCSSLLLRLGGLSTQYPVPSSPCHAHLLTELQIDAELVRSRLDRKPARSITFETKTAWAG